MSTPTKTTYLVAGGSRGIGLAYVREILTTDPHARVIATARNPSTATKLQEIIKEFDGRIQTLALDLADKKQIRAAAEEAKKLSFAAEGIDVLINNAAIFEGGFSGPLEPNAIETLEANIAVNLIGVAATDLAFLPLLRKGHGRKIWTISSTGGSIGGPFGDQPFVATYGTSKAAVNMWSRKLAAGLKEEGFTVINLCPGTVKTEMSGGEGELEPEESAKMGLAVFKSKGAEESGSFWNHKGETVPW